MPKTNCLDIISIPYESNGEILFSKIRDLPYSCWLDSGKPDSHYGRYDIISALPVARLVNRGNITDIYHTDTYHNISGTPTGESHHTSTEDPLELLKAELGKLTPVANPVNNGNPIPFSGGAIGYFSYELGRHYRGLKNSHGSVSAFADMQIGIYQWALVQDHHLQTAQIVSLPECDPAILKEVRKRLADKKSQTQLAPLCVEQLSSTISREHYLQQLSIINEYILAGDCYQVNFAQCFEGSYTGEPYTAYRQLREVMASPFSAYLELGEQSIMSLSPERFLQVEDSKVLTQPIKGTSPRHKEPLEDKRQAEKLIADEKNRAENLMIVDLLRNDLGQHCIPGTITVDKLFGLQSFPNVHHLVSDVSGQLRKETHSVDLFRDCFPGGSITGAPKKRAMEIIDELETGARGIYCGSIGYISSNGNMDTNIAIRTVSCDGKKLYCWGGGGIVADSHPEDEYQESLNKINAILKTLSP